MIVIPMAGMSSRFFKAGYTKPKYMLEAHNKTLFEWSVLSFKHYFENTPFVFIIRDVYETKDFIHRKIQQLEIKTAYVIMLEEETRGQAETVSLGLNQLIEQGINTDTPICIFNIDTFRPEFRFPEVVKQGCGYLEVFRGTGDNWSFAKPLSHETTLVSETAEKRPISDLCSTGLYYFKHIKDFFDAYQHYFSTPDLWEKGELYIAPLYNWLIQNNKTIHYHCIDRKDVIFCGTPDEYSEFLKRSYLC